MRAGLVVAEFAIALVLLVGCGLLVRSLLRLQQVDPGFDVPHLVAAPIAPPSPKYDDPVRALTLYREAVEAVAAEPGVEAAGPTSPVPLTRAGNPTPPRSGGKASGHH